MYTQLDQGVPTRDAQGDNRSPVVLDRPAHTRIPGFSDLHREDVEGPRMISPSASLSLRISQRASFSLNSVDFIDDELVVAVCYCLLCSPAWSPENPAPNVRPCPTERGAGVGRCLGLRWTRHRRAHPPAPPLHRDSAVCSPVTLESHPQLQTETFEVSFSKRGIQGKATIPALPG